MYSTHESYPNRGSDLNINYEKGVNPNNITSIIAEIDRKNNKASEIEKMNINTKENMEDELMDKLSKRQKTPVYIKGDKTITCYNCELLLLVKDEWNAIRCPQCNNINRIPLGDSNKQQEFQINNSKNHFDLYLPYVFILITCPFCQTENKARKDTDHMICHKCSNSFSILFDTNRNNINQQQSNFNANQYCHPLYSNGMLNQQNQFINSNPPGYDRLRMPYPNQSQSIQSQLNRPNIQPRIQPDHLNHPNLNIHNYPTMPRMPCIHSLNAMNNMPFMYEMEHPQKRNETSPKIESELMKYLKKMNSMRNINNKTVDNEYKRNYKVREKKEKIKALKDLINTVDKISNNTIKSANFKLQNNNEFDIISRIPSTSKSNNYYDAKKNNYANPLKSQSMYKNIFSDDLLIDNYQNFKRDEKIGKYGTEDYILASQVNGSG